MMPYVFESFTKLCFLGAVLHINGHKVTFPGYALLHRNVGIQKLS